MGGLGLHLHLRVFFVFFQVRFWSGAGVSCRGVARLIVRRRGVGVDKYLYWYCSYLMVWTYIVSCNAAEGSRRVCPYRYCRTFMLFDVDIGPLSLCALCFSHGSSWYKHGPPFLFYFVVAAVLLRPTVAGARKKRGGRETHARTQAKHAV